MIKTKHNQAGFSVVELVLVVVVVGVIAAIGAFVYRNKQMTTKKPVSSDSSIYSTKKASTTAQKAPAYQATHVAPSSWLQCVDNDYAISFSYPANWNVTKSVQTDSAYFGNTFSADAKKVVIYGLARRQYHKCLLRVFS